MTSPASPQPDVAVLDVVMGGITYRVRLPRADHHALTVAVHDALTGLGLEPHVRAHGMERDQVGALRHRPNLARLVTSRSNP